MVGRRKIANYWKKLFKLLVAMKFSPVVKCYGLENLSVFTNCSNTGFVDFINCSSLALLDDDEASLSLYEGDDAMMAIPADDGISFPVADTDSVVDFNGPVLDHAFSC